MIEPTSLAIYQFAPELGAIEANAARITEAVAEADADLLITPELALTGYSVGDDAARLALRPAQAAELLPVAPHTGLMVGFVERGDDTLSYNAALIVRPGHEPIAYRKVYLPTYGMFDEGRFFGRGARCCCFDAGRGWRIGLLICEDLWHPAMSYLLSAQGAMLIVVLTAAPGLRVRDAGPASGRFASWDVWRDIARTTAAIYGVYVALGNRVGVEDGVTFAGGSLLAGPDGELVREAPADRESLLTAVLSPDRVAQARRPFAHARDDDPHLTLRELRRILEGR